MLGRFSCFIPLAAIALAALTPAANANTVYAATFEISAEGGTPISHPGTVNGSGCNLGSEGGCESSTASLAYSNGDITSSVSGSNSGGVAVANASAQTDGTFWFELVGPANVSVPLIITANGTTSANGPDTEGLVQIFFGGGSFYACTGAGNAASSCVSEPASFSGSKSYSLTSNTLSDVEVIVAGSSSLGSSSFSASADPMVVIDPSFVNADEFSLVFSADVPEPSSLALLFIGLALLAGSIHRRPKEVK